MAVGFAPGRNPSSIEMRVVEQTRSMHTGTDVIPPTYPSGQDEIE
jgi:hypothetical protein